MSKKPLWCASLAVAVVGACLVFSQLGDTSLRPLSPADLQIAVGACEAHGSLQMVTCEIASDPCTGATAPECEADTWHGGCVGVNSPKPEGSGSENHKEVNCTNTYDAGPCFYTSVTGAKCAPLQATSNGLTCGTKIGADDC